MIYLASDHAGFELKEKLKSYLTGENEEFADLGCDSTESCDYPDYAHSLAEKITAEPGARGVAICGNGIGISMALNRHVGIRAARAVSVEDAEMTRRHNDANVLVLGGRTLTSDLAKKIVEKFLITKFEGGRHESRVKKIEI